MGRTTRTYSRVKEAELMIETLCKQYPEAFWAVNSGTIAVMGVDNVERSEKAIAKQPVWSKMRNVKGVEQAIFQENKIVVRYIVEIFWSDWHAWSNAIKAAMLAQHLFEITPEVEVKNHPDCVGFKILYHALGVNWARSGGQGIPNLLDGDVEFDMDLRPGLSELESMDEGDGPEDPGDPEGI